MCLESRRQLFRDGGQGDEAPDKEKQPTHELSPLLTPQDVLKARRYSRQFNYL